MDEDLDLYKSELSAYFVGDKAAEFARDMLDRYFREGYSGAWFDRLADVERPNQITSQDLVAVSMLGVDVPPHVAIWLLNEGAAPVSELLEQMPADIDIWDDDTMLLADRPAWKLWTLLDEGCWPAPKTGNGMGTTTISKLMAAKRPRLIPVYDSVVARLLPETRNYWKPFSHALADRELRRHIETAVATAPAGVSVLRRIDIVVWMAGHTGTSPSG